jgi:hypothetical protein
MEERICMYVIHMYTYDSDMNTQGSLYLLIVNTSFGDASLLAEASRYKRLRHCCSIG